MITKIRHSSLSDVSKLLCLALSILFGMGALWSNSLNSQAGPAQDSFRGSFFQDTSGEFDTSEDRQASSSIAFIESDGGRKYATYTQFLFYLSPRYEYIVDGVVVQKHLPEKSKFADYSRIVQLAWPDYASDDLKCAAKKVETWVKKNPSKPLLLINSIRRVAPSVEKEREPIKVMGNVQESRLIIKVEPFYPEAAKQKRISGEVVLVVTVDKEGKVEEIRVSSGHPVLAAAAVRAVQQWQYSPTLLNGEPVPVIANVTVRFGLR